MIKEKQEVDVLDSYEGKWKNLQIGEVWLERDNRFKRYIKIIRIDGDDIYISTCCQDGLNVKHRITRASRGRFNGKYGGYRYLFLAPVIQNKD